MQDAISHQSSVLDEIFLKPSATLIENRFSQSSSENAVCKAGCNGKCNSSTDNNEF